MIVDGGMVELETKKKKKLKIHMNNVIFITAQHRRTD